MTQTRFRDTRLRLTDLVTAADPALTHVIFTSCVIEGPALLQPIGCQFVANDYGVDDHHAASALWTVNPWDPLVTGAVVARDCVFRHCTFTGVAFAGGPGLLASLRSALPLGPRAS